MSKSYILLIFASLVILLGTTTVWLYHDELSGDGSNDESQPVQNETPRLYELENLSVVKDLGNIGEVIIRIQSVEVSPEDYMKFNMNWTATVIQYMPGSTVKIAKESDADNSSIYVTDDLGNRYDHFDAGGDATKLVALEDQQAASGWFMFPPPKEGATVFTFHDDDVPVVEIPNIVLSSKES